MAYVYVYHSSDTLTFDIRALQSDGTDYGWAIVRHIGLCCPSVEPMRITRRTMSVNSPRYTGRDWKMASLGLLRIDYLLLLKRPCSHDDTNTVTQSRC